MSGFLQRIVRKFFPLNAKWREAKNGKTIVRHVKDSTSLDKIDGTSSPSEFWKKHYNEPVPPSDFICTSCMTKKQKDDFVVGHVEDVDGTKMWLYPVCDTCNKTYKGYKAEDHLFYANNDKLKDITNIVKKNV